MVRMMMVKMKLTRSKLLEILSLLLVISFLFRFSCGAIVTAFDITLFRSRLSVDVATR